jgi:hypothetical protein
MEKAESKQPDVEQSGDQESVVAVEANPLQKTLFLAWLTFAAIAFVLFLSSQATEVRLLASLFAVASGLALAWRGTTYLEIDRTDAQTQIIAGAISSLVWIPVIFLVII